MKNLRKLYERLIPENRNILVSLLAKEYGISESSIRTNWLSNGKIPEYAEKRAHEITTNILVSQMKKTGDIVLEK